MIDRLYKYGKLGSYSETFFTSSHVRFSSPSELNDPFECRPWFTFDGDRHEVVEQLAKLYRKFQGLTRDSATAAAVADYLEGRHRNPFHWEQLRIDITHLLGKSIGLYCLSEVPDSILMWSHYALEHTGYCVEFEATDTTPVFGAAQSVLYREEYPMVDYFKTPTDEQVDLIFLTKHVGWSYEREWRVIDHEVGPGLRDYPIGLMRSVTFGLRMQTEDKSKIRAWVKRRGAFVKFYQARQHSQKFAIDLQEIL